MQMLESSLIPPTAKIQRRPSFKNCLKRYSYLLTVSYGFSKIILYSVNQNIFQPSYSCCTLICSWIMVNRRINICRAGRVVVQQPGILSTSWLTFSWRHELVGYGSISWLAAATCYSVESFFLIPWSGGVNLSLVLKVLVFVNLLLFLITCISCSYLHCKRCIK